MRKKIIVGTVAVLVVCLAAVGLINANKQSAQKTIVLRAVDVHPDDYPTTRSTKYMAQLVEERSGGRIKIKVYGSGVLGEGKVIKQAMEEGIVDINREGIDMSMDGSPIAQAVALPYMFRDTDHVWKVLDGNIGERLKGEMAAQNKVVLAYYDSGLRSFYTDHPINTPADLNGQKYRVLGSDVFKKVMDILQASSMKLGYNDIYPALQTKKVDGAENNIPSYMTAKHFEFAPYYSFDEHTALPEILFISKAAWDKLSPEDQQLLKECGDEAGRYQRQQWKEFTEKCMADLQAKGVQFVRPDKKAFQDAMQPLYSQYPQLGGLVQEIQAVK